ncbi:hypothetical protein JB92DRAFT_3113484 [Gautieria morchelliformis]|nr:hypothetical protein JB92DRAFT_3113484 [Gautieria morchelliformis]
MTASPNAVKPRERPVPIRPQMDRPRFPASVSLYDPTFPLSLQVFRKLRQPESKIQPLPSPTPASQNPPNGSKKLSPNHAKRNRIRFNSSHSSPVRLAVPY